MEKEKAICLTETQKASLEFLEEYTRERGIAPTHREICERFGYSSYGTVYKHLKLLQEKGYLKRDGNQKRGIELIRAIPGGGLNGIEGGGDLDLPFYGRIAAVRQIEAVGRRQRVAGP